MAAINALVGDVLHVILMRQLKGRQRLSALRSAVTITCGREYDEGLFQETLEEWGGAKGQALYVDDFFMVLDLDANGNHRKPEGAAAL